MSCMRLYTICICSNTCFVLRKIQETKDWENKPPANMYITKKSFTSFLVLMDKLLE